MLLPRARFVCVWMLASFVLGVVAGVMCHCDMDMGPVVRAVGGGVVGLGFGFISLLMVTMVADIRDAANTGRRDDL